MLSYEKKKWIVTQKNKGHLSDWEIASAQKVTRMTVYRIFNAYNQSGLSAFEDKPVGRKADVIPERLCQEILEKRKQGYGIRTIEGLLSLNGLKISHNKIHRFLRAEGLVKPEPKKGRRNKYIRWERNHSNSLWQTDFCWIERLGCWLTGWLDDHSRFITSAEYIKEATTEESLRIFEGAAHKYGYPRETLSDRGTQYYAVRGETSRFLEHMQSRRVNHIYASVKKPTTCGKLERFWGTHNKERWNFTSLQDFIQFYNFKRPHMSLNYKTPYEVYKRDFKV